MDLINKNKPVLLIHPSYQSDCLQQAAIELTEELTNIIRDIDFESATAKEISKVIRVCKRGIVRIMSMEGSTPILSTDSINAETILNEAIEILAQALNEAMLELKKRAMTGESLFDYVEQLDSMIDTCLSWSKGKAEVEPEEEVQLIYEDDEQWL